MPHDAAVAVGMYRWRMPAASRYWQNSLPLYQGAQVAVDNTLVSPRHGSSEGRSRATSGRFRRG